MTAIFIIYRYYQVLQSTNEVILNSVDIVIKHVAFHTTNEKNMPANEIMLKPAEDTATIIFPESLPIGKTGFLHFEFQ